MGVLQGSVPEMVFVIPEFRLAALLAPGEYLVPTSVESQIALVGKDTPEQHEQIGYHDLLRGGGAHGCMVHDGMNFIS